MAAGAAFAHPRRSSGRERDARPRPRVRPIVFLTHPGFIQCHPPSVTKMSQYSHKTSQVDISLLWFMYDAYDLTYSILKSSDFTPAIQCFPTSVPVPVSSLGCGQCAPKSLHPAEDSCVKPLDHVRSLSIGSRRFWEAAFSTCPHALICDLMRASSDSILVPTTQCSSVLGPTTRSYGHLTQAPRRQSTSGGQHAPLPS